MSEPPDARSSAADESHLTPNLDVQLRERLSDICSLVQRQTGHDFANYKEGTLLRRIRRRMQISQSASVVRYLELLESSTAEADAVLKELLIGVTQFFRDPEAFESLAQRVIPRLTQSRSMEAPIRIWVPGCATGEEAYSIAILVHEHLERIGQKRFVQLFATDLDAGMLIEAREGRYSASMREHVRGERLFKYFTSQADDYLVNEDLRDTCLFAQHSLIRDPPFSQLDLISCRNVLIYLCAELQRKVLQLFHYALKPGGFLFLGSSEGVTQSAELFEILDERSRIYCRKEVVARPVVQFPLSVRTATAERAVAAGQSQSGAKERVSGAFERTILQEYAPASAVIDARGDVHFVAGPLARYLELPVGAPTTNLFETLRGALRLELRTALGAAVNSRRACTRSNIVAEVEGQTRSCNLHVRPMPTIDAAAGLFLVVIERESVPSELQAAQSELEEPAAQRLESELLATRAELRTTVEELESANEELKSANEELISTNEELQSANEELQVSREELQSLNEELETLNAELREKLAELAAANRSAQLQAQLVHLSHDAIFVRQFDGTIESWNYGAQELYGYDADEAIGRNSHELLRTQFPEPLADIEAELRSRGAWKGELRHRTKDGRHVLVLSSKQYARGEDGVERILEANRDNTRRAQAERDLRESEERLRLFIHHAPASLAMFDREMRYLSVSKRWLTDYRLGDRDLHGLCHYDLFPDVTDEWKDVHRRALSGEVVRADVDRFMRADGSVYWLRWEVRPWHDADGGVGGIVVFSEDITEITRVSVERELLAQQRQVALDAARLGWWYYEPSNRVAKHDRRCSQILGVSDDEKDDRGLLKSAHPDDLPRVQAAMQAALDPVNPKPYGVEYRVNRADGTQGWVEAYGLAEFEGNGEARRVKSFVGTVADITERKQAEESLRRHALVVQQSRDIILFMDRDTGRILEVNPAGCGAYGYDRDELLGLCIHDLRAPGTGDSLAEQMQDADAAGVLFETWHRRKDGSVFPVEVSSRGAAVGSSRTLVSVVRDITERYRAESREREQRLQAEQRAAELDTILDALTEPLMVCDAQGNVVGANPAFRRMLGNEDIWKGVSAAERIRLTKMQTADGQALDPQASPGVRALAGETVRGFLQRLPRGDGSVLHLSTSSAPIRTGEGIIGAVVVFSDITERVRAEQELREVDQRKNEFLAMLSHELRNPLTPIRNSLFILKNAVPGSIQARRAEEIIDRQTSQLVRLVDDLLDVTRISQNKIRLRLHPLDLSNLVERAVEDHRMLFEERGILLGFQRCSEPLLINGDDARLAQIVGNLLSNAAKFTAPGGVVTVKLLKRDSQLRAQLWVIDTGAGIEPANLRRLFLPFMQAEVTLDRSEGGLGLGLALVKSLVEAHGGEVCAHSDGLGKGTQFVVELPIAVPVVNEAKRTELGTKRRVRRVLIIEDNLDAAESLRDALEFWGHIVEVAHNGTDGLVKARQFNPEIVLCDIGLPGMDGYELARAFNREETLKETYLIALTGYALPDDLERAAQAGFKRHLAKPPTLEDLEQVLAGAP